MTRSEQVLLKPTVKQTRLLLVLLLVAWEVYNAALQERRDAWRMRRVSLSKYTQQQQVKYLHELRPDVMRFGTRPVRGSIVRVDRALDGFFRRVKAYKEAKVAWLKAGKPPGKQPAKPGYPRYKNKARFDTVSYEDQGCWQVKDGRLHLYGIGAIKLKLHRSLPGIPKALHVHREGKRWYAIFMCEVAQAEPLPKTGRQVGIDRGVTVLAALSDGTLVENPKWFAKGAEQLANAQRDLARKTNYRSNRRKANVQQVAKAHRKIANQRRDHLHKVSRAVVDTYDVIVLEDLQIENMVKTPKPRPNEQGGFDPNGAAAKSGLNRAIHDAGWGMLARFIAYKAEEAGRDLVLVPAPYTSQSCSSCGHVDAGNRRGTVFKCLACGYEAHADVNAAINVLRAGQSSRGNPSIEPAA